VSDEVGEKGGKRTGGSLLDKLGLEGASCKVIAVNEQDGRTAGISNVRKIGKYR